MDQSWHPAGRFLTVEGVRCHVVDLAPSPAATPPGPASEAAFEAPPTLVLLHGIAVSSWAWRHNVDVLARDFRVIAICQQGHGWSGRPARADYSLAGLSRFVLGALDQLGVPHATFIGNSLGGAVSLWTALHAPERVERLVLVNPASHLRQLPWVALHTQIAALLPFYRAVLGPTLIRIPLAGLAYRNLPIDREYLAGIWAPYLREGAMAATLATMRALPAGIAALDARLPGVAHETLVIWGERDDLLPARTAHRLVRFLPRARLVTFAASGHCPQEEEPARFNQVVRSFVHQSIRTPHHPR